MVQRSKELRLALEAGQAIRINCKQLRQDLQRDVAIQFGIARAIHLTHAAGAEGSEHFVSVETNAGRERHDFLGIAAGS